MCETLGVLRGQEEIKPTYLPSVPRIFEKVYTLVMASQPEEVQAQMKAAAGLGVKVRDMVADGQPVPPELQEKFDQADEQLYKNVRAVFGGRVQHAVSGAAPIAPEILEFFYGCGVPVLEGYGMTETSTVSTYSTIEEHRFGSVGKLLPGVEGRIAEDGELLLKGPNIFRGYYKNDDASFFITGRKKDIIITAGGKNLTPANIENDMKQSRWISQAVMYGDRRPYPVMLVTLDEEQVVPWAREQGIEDTSVAALAHDPKVRELIQSELDRANAKYATAEQVKRFFILDHDLSQETGELTPTLKVKRNVVYDKYAESFDALYGGGAS